MRILHIISSIDPKHGGVTNAVLTIIRALDNAKLKNDIVSLDNPVSEFLFTLSLDFTIYPLGPTKTPYKYSGKLISWLRLNLSNYDKVIIHGLWQYHAFAAFKIWRERNISSQLFIMPHGMLDPWFQRASGRRIKAIRNWILWKLTESQLVNYSDGILFTCETEKLLARIPFKPYKPKLEIVVGLGVELPPEYSPAMKRDFLKVCPSILENYILFVSRINEKKGIDLLIKAYLSLRHEGVRLPQLVIAGPGLNSLYGNELKRLAQVDKNILFVDMISGAAKWGAFYGCSVFILPSHQENFGIAVVEAMACKKPVLISNQVNIWREISDSQSGLVAEDNIQSIEDMLRKWFSISSTKQKEMGLKAYDTYINKFSVKTVLKNFYQVLH